MQQFSGKLAVGLLLTIGLSLTRAEISPFERIYRLGNNLFDTYMPKEMRDELSFPSPDEWQMFWRDLDRILSAHSIEDLADWQPAVAVALKYLEFQEDAQPLAAWLRQKLDYFVMAGDAVGGPESAAPVTPDKPALQPAPIKPPPLPADTTTAARHAMVRSRSAWEERLRQRDPPAAGVRLAPSLKAIFIQEGVPPEWIWIAEVESSMNPAARSPAGAAGLFQFMPDTAVRFGLRLTPQDERFLPHKSALAAARYLTFLHTRFDCWSLALAAYNSGEGRVGRLLSSRGVTDFEEIVDGLPLETQMYVPKVLATVALRENVDPLSLPAPRR